MSPWILPKLARVSAHVAGTSCSARANARPDGLPTPRDCRCRRCACARRRCRRRRPGSCGSSFSTPSFRRTCTRHAVERQLPDMGDACSARTHVGLHAPSAAPGPAPRWAAPCGSDRAARAHFAPAPAARRAPAAAPPRCAAAPAGPPAAPGRRNRANFDCSLPVSSGTLRARSKASSPVRSELPSLPSICAHVPDLALLGQLAVQRIARRRGQHHADQLVQVGQVAPCRLKTASAPSSVARLAIVPLARRRGGARRSRRLPAGTGCCSGALRYSTLPVRPCAVNGSFCQVPLALKLRGIAGRVPSAVVAVVPEPRGRRRAAGPSIANSVWMSAP